MKPSGSTATSRGARILAGSWWTPEAVKLAVLRMLEHNRLLVCAGRRRWPFILRELERQGFPRMTLGQLMLRIRPVTPMLRAVRKKHANDRRWDDLLYRLETRRGNYLVRKDGTPHRGEHTTDMMYNPP